MKNTKTLLLIITFIVLSIIIGSCKKQTPTEEYDSAVQSLLDAKSLTMLTTYNVNRDYDTRGDSGPRDEKLAISTSTQYKLLDDTAGLSIDNSEIKSILTVGAQGNSMNTTYFYQDKIIYLKPSRFSQLFYMDTASEAFAALPETTVFLLADDLLTKGVSADRLSVSEKTIFVNGDMLDARCFEVKLSEADLSGFRDYFDLVIESGKREIENPTDCIIYGDFNYKAYTNKKGQIILVEIGFSAELPDPVETNKTFIMTVSSTTEISDADKTKFEFPDFSDAMDFLMFSPF